jgi:hypothetical protein
MLRSYLIETRICYDGDGGSNGGGNGGGDNQQPDPSFGENRLAGGTTNVVDTSRRANPAVELSDEDFDQDLQQDIAAAAAVSRGQDAGQPLGFSEAGLNISAPGNPQGYVAGSDFLGAYQSDPDAMRQVIGATADIIGSSNPMATQQQLAQDPALQQTLVNLSGGVAPAAAPSRQEQSAFRREMVRNLLENSVQDSLADPNRPGPVTPNRPPGRNDPQSGFYSDIYRDLYGGTAPGTGIGSILSGGILGGLSNAPDPADAAAFNVGQLMSLPGAVRDPQTGLVSGAQAGPGTLSMNSLGGIVYSGPNDPNYEGPFANLVRGTAGQNMSGGDDGGSSQPASQPPAPATVDPGTTPPEVIDDLAVNYLRDPFYLYSGQSNLFQPYGYAGGTLVDLLQTRRMTQPQQAAANLNLFGNPRDFM